MPHLQKHCRKKKYIEIHCLMRLLLETIYNRQNSLLHAHFTKFGREDLMFLTIRVLKLATCLPFDTAHIRLCCFGFFFSNSSVRQAKTPQSTAFKKKKKACMRVIFKQNIIKAHEEHLSNWVNEKLAGRMNSMRDICSVTGRADLLEDSVPA